MLMLHLEGMPSRFKENVTYRAAHFIRLRRNHRLRWWSCDATSMWGAIFMCDVTSVFL